MQDLSFGISPLKLQTGRDIKDEKIDESTFYVDLELPIKNLSESFNDLYMCYFSDDELDDSLMVCGTKKTKTKLKSFLSRSSSDITTLERKKKMLDDDDNEPIKSRSSKLINTPDFKRSHSFNEEFLRRIPKPRICFNTTIRSPVKTDTLLPCFTSKFPQYYCIDGKTVF